LSLKPFTPIIRQLVPHQFSSLGDSAERRRILDADHFSMIKFEGRADPRYEAVREDIRELVAAATRKRFLRHDTPQIRTHGPDPWLGCPTPDLMRNAYRTLMLVTTAVATPHKDLVPTGKCDASAS
jgi:hypothetical protein